MEITSNPFAIKTNKNNETNETSREAPVDFADHMDNGASRSESHSDIST